MTEKNYALEASGALSVKQIESEVCVCVDGLKALKQKVDRAIEKAVNAKRLSNDAKNVTLAWWKIGDKAEAIEALQKAMVGVSDAQSEQAEAMQIVLQYQRDVANGMKFLFRLGAGNMVANRTVVKEVEMRLRNASDEEIGEMARKELAGVVAQLKMQLDLQERQNRLAEDQSRVKASIRENQSAINAIERKDSERDRRIADNDKVDEAQNVEIRRQAEKDVEHDRKIAQNASGIAEAKSSIAEHAEAMKELRHADDKQDAEIERQAQKDKEIEGKADENSRRIAGNAKEIEKNAQMIAELEERLKSQRRQIAQTRMLGYEIGRAHV